MKKKIPGWIFILLLPVCLRAALADPALSIQDESVRAGDWAEVYAEILSERAADIRAYQDHVLSLTSLPACRPVDLRDLDGDHIPELIFIELGEDEEYQFEIGRLWIYTSDGKEAHCALTLQPQTDDLLYSRYYLAKNGLLTLRFSEMEMNWILQLRADVRGNYVPENELREQADFSGEGPDSYFLNGEKISRKKYRNLEAQIRQEQGEQIGSFMVEEGRTGFAYTLEEALAGLSDGSIPRALAAEDGSLLSADGALPELSFTKGSFTPGQKFDVYSAPSNRSWRGAQKSGKVSPRHLPVPPSVIHSCRSP